MTIRSNWGQSKSSAQPRRNAALPADLKAELDKIREVAPPPPTVDPLYKYLRRVYRLRQKLETSHEWQDAVVRYHNVHRLRLKENYVRFIIQQTAGDHVTDKMKNKYKIALQLALEEAIKPVDVIAFIKKHGGLNGCIELWKEKYGGTPRKKK